MARSVTLFVIIGLLVVLAVQNTSPPIALVVLGGRTPPLPLSVWLLAAIASGAVTTLLLYGFANLSTPSRRSYRPMGQRIRSSAPEPRDRQSDDAASRLASEPVAATASPRRPNRGADRPKGAPKSAPKSAYDTDWESFKAPERWDDWGNKPDPRRVAETKAEKAQSPKRGFGFKREPYSATASVNEIESGWDGYEAPATQPEPDDLETGWDTAAAKAPPQSVPHSSPSRPAPDHERPTTRVYDSGSLYDRPPQATDEFITEDIFDDSEDIFEDRSDDLEPAQVGPDGVYEADYRVIIPPYKPLDDDEADSEDQAPR